MHYVINIREENWDICRANGIHSFGDKASRLARDIRPGDTFVVWRPTKGFIANGTFTSVAVEGVFESPWPNYQTGRSIVGIRVDEEFSPVKDRWTHRGDRSMRFGISKAGLQTGLQTLRSMRFGI